MRVANRTISWWFLVLVTGFGLVGVGAVGTGCAPRSGGSANEPAGLEAPKVPAAPPAAVSEPPPPAAPASKPVPRAELTSWRAGGARAQIERFVADATNPKSAAFVLPEDRVAVFDNDGTLWSEQPLYFQMIFALDFVKAELGRTDAKVRPSWANRPWAQKLAKDGSAALAHLGEKDLIEIAIASQAGVTTEEFGTRVRRWLETARHPRFDRPYTEVVFQPMIELLAVLREHGFATYVVSGGDVSFMRVFTNAVYGIPPEQVIGSTMAMKYEVAAGRGALRFEPKLGNLNDGAEKPVNIERQIGKRPVFVAGNSDGDRQMLEFGTLGRPGTLGLIVHHDDAAREWAYDRASKIGKLDLALDEAASATWLVVSMKADFARVYSFEEAPPAGP